VEYADNTKASLGRTIPAKLLLSSEALYYQKYKKIPPCGNLKLYKGENMNKFLTHRKNTQGEAW
jgi:hypothetical protein